MSETPQQHILLTDEALKFRMMAEATTDGILAHEAGEVLAVNTALCEMVAMSEEELVGSSAFDRIAKEDLPRVLEYLKAGYDKPYEVGCVRKDGSVFPALLNVKQTELDGHTIRTISVHDLTDQREVEETIREQGRALMELSTPAIRVWQGLLLMPLIGAIDTARAQQITSALLESVASDEIEVAILDVTGVPFIDTGVARHLIQAVEGAKLLGAGGDSLRFQPGRGADTGSAWRGLHQSSDVWIAACGHGARVRDARPEGCGGPEVGAAGQIQPGSSC